MKEYVVEFFKRAYELISPEYRLIRYNAMKKAGVLEKMCSSEIHRRFRIHKEF